MALNATTLKTAILSSLTAAGFNVTGWTTPVNYLDKFVEAIATGIVTHIQTNAVVTTTSGAPDGEHTGNIT